MAMKFIFEGKLNATYYVGEKFWRRFFPAKHAAFDDWLTKCKKETS